MLWNELILRKQIAGAHKPRQFVFYAVHGNNLASRETTYIVRQKGRNQVSFQELTENTNIM